MSKALVEALEAYRNDHSNENYLNVAKHILMDARDGVSSIAELYKDSEGEVGLRIKCLNPWTKYLSIASAPDSLNPESDGDVIILLKEVLRLVIEDQDLKGIVYDEWKNPGVYVDKRLFKDYYPSLVYSCPEQLIRSLRTYEQEMINDNYYKFIQELIIESAKGMKIHVPFNLKDNNKTYITIPSEDGYHYVGVFTSPDALNEFQAGFADTIPMETVIRAIVNDKTPGVNGICFDYNYKRPAICMQKEALSNILSLIEN